jgi:hypothetical protein
MEEEPEHTLNDIIVNYDYAQESMVDITLIEDGIMYLFATREIEVPPRGFIAVPSGITLKRSDLCFKKIHPDDLTYHFVNDSVAGMISHRVDLYQNLDSAIKTDILKNRIYIGSEILLKIANDTDELKIVEKSDGLGLIYAVKRIYKMSPAVPQPLRIPPPPRIQAARRPSRRRQPTRAQSSQEAENTDPASQVSVDDTKLSIVN